MNETYKMQETDFLLFELTPLDRKILKFVSEYPDCDLNQLSDWFKISEKQLVRIIQKPAFLRAKQLAARKVDELLTDAQKLGLKRMMKILQEGSDKDAIRAAKVVADWKKEIIQQNDNRTVVFKTVIGDSGTLSQQKIDYAQDAEYILETLNGGKDDTGRGLGSGTKAIQEK